MSDLARSSSAGATRFNTWSDKKRGKQKKQTHQIGLRLHNNLTIEIVDGYRWCHGDVDCRGPCTFCLLWIFWGRRSRPVVYQSTFSSCEPCRAWRAEACPAPRQSCSSGRPRWHRRTAALRCAFRPKCSPKTTCRWPGRTGCPAALRAIGKIATGCTGISTNMVVLMSENQPINQDARCDKLTLWPSWQELPKSTILMADLFGLHKRMFSGLRSQWIILSSGVDRKSRAVQSCWANLRVKLSETPRKLVFRNRSYRL